MNEFFAIQVDAHLQSLEWVRDELKKLDTYPLDQVDRSRLSCATKALASDIERFRKFAEVARKEEGALV